MARPTGAKRTATIEPELEAHTEAAYPEFELPIDMTETAAEITPSVNRAGRLAGFLIVRQQIATEEVNGIKRRVPTGNIVAELQNEQYLPDDLSPQRFQREHAIRIVPMDQISSLTNLSPPLQEAVRTIFRAIGVKEVHVDKHIFIVRNPAIPYALDREHITQGLWVPTIARQRDYLQKQAASRSRFEGRQYAPPTLGAMTTKEEEEAKARSAGKGFY